MQEDFLHFIAGHAVVQRATDVQFELGRAVHRRQHGQVQEAAGFAVQPVARPHRAPGVFGDKLLPIFGERIGLGDGLIDILGAQYFAADFQARFEAVIGVQRHGLMGYKVLTRRQAYRAASWASSSLQDGAHTACALPKTFLVPMSERARCLPHMKQDMVAPPKEAAAANGEPDTLDL